MRVNKLDHPGQRAGLDIERTAEDWMFKACTDDVVVGVLHRLNGVPVALDSAYDHDVLAIRLPVLLATFVLIQKLRALGEQYCETSPRCCARAWRSASALTGTKCVTGPPTTTLPRRSWCWRTGWGSPVDATHALVSQWGDCGRRATRIGLACRLPRDSQLPPTTRRQ